MKYKKRTEACYTDLGYRTIIDPRFDVYGEILEAKTRMKFLKLARIQKSITNTYERNISVSSPILTTIVSHLQLPSIIAVQSMNLFKKVIEKGLTRGSSVKNLMLACIYIAIRKNNLPRTLEELEEVSEVSKKTIGKYFRKLQKELNIKLEPIDVEPFIDRFGNNLGLPMKLQNEAKNILKVAKDNGLLIGGDPKGFAGAVLYIVAKKSKELKINQKS